MSHRSLLIAAIAVAGLASGFAGCSCSIDPPRPNAVATGTTTGGRSDSTDQPADSGTKDTASEAPKEFKFGDLIEPFTPPKLEELDKTAEWVDRPVVDAMKLLRDKLAQEQPLATVAEALKLRNDSEDNNNKIVSALGRPPAKDEDVNWDAEINRHGYGDVNSTNPILSSSVVESEVNQLMAFGLFSFDWEFNPFASSDTVKSWQTSKDGMYDKVVIRDDLTWSDGHAYHRARRGIQLQDDHDRRRARAGPAEWDRQDEMDRGL